LANLFLFGFSRFSRVDNRGTRLLQRKSTSSPLDRFPPFLQEASSLSLFFVHQQVGFVEGSFSHPPSRWRHFTKRPFPWPTGQVSFSVFHRSTPPLSFLANREGNSCGSNFFFFSVNPPANLTPLLLTPPERPSFSSTPTGPPPLSPTRYTKKQWQVTGHGFFPPLLCTSAHPPGRKDPPLFFPATQRPYFLYFYPRLFPTDVKLPPIPSPPSQPNTPPFWVGNPLNPTSLLTRFPSPTLSSVFSPLPRDSPLFPSFLAGAHPETRPPSSCLLPSPFPHPPIFNSLSFPPGTKRSSFPFSPGKARNPLFLFPLSVSPFSCRGKTPLF